MIMYSTEGGMDIEKWLNIPHLIFTEEIDPTYGLQGWAKLEKLLNLGLSGEAFKKW